MLRYDSIMSRILFLHVVAVVITAICMPLALYRLLQSDIDNLQRRTLQTQAEALARHLIPRADGSLAFELSSELRGIYSEAYSRYAYAVIDDAGKVLFSSQNNGKPIFPTAHRSSDIEFLKTRQGEAIISGAILSKQLAGRTITIQVSEDLAHRDVVIDDVVANFLQKVGWITLPIMLLLLATDILIFRRAVQPLLRASERAEHISPTRIGVRLPIEEIPKEILPLVIAVNQALDRLEQGFFRQREFTADAAHELRTPLAVLRTRIDMLPDQRAAKALHQDVEGMSRVVSQLLDAAELETLVIEPGEVTDLQAVCADVAEFVAPLALAREKTISLTGEEGAVRVRGNAEMLRRAIRNLVENALSHTPKGTDVEIAVEKSGTVRVLDQGEGVPLANRELIFQRFWRRSHQRAGGAGLGLSIVKRIVETHGGTIAVENRPGGGAVFSMTFTLAEPTPDSAAESGAAMRHARLATSPEAAVH